jgi:hypothetical protein
LLAAIFFVMQSLICCRRIAPDGAGGSRAAADALIRNAPVAQIAIMARCIAILLSSRPNEERASKSLCEYLPHRSELQEWKVGIVLSAIINPNFADSRTPHPIKVAALSNIPNVAGVNNAPII